MGILIELALLYLVLWFSYNAYNTVLLKSSSSLARV